MKRGLLSRWPVWWRRLCVALLALVVAFTTRGGRVAEAQAATAKSAGVEGNWQGVLHVPPHDLRTVLKISKAPSGELAATMFSIDQGAQGFAVSSITFSGGTLKFAITALDLTYEGKVGADGNVATGTLTQGGHALPVNFERATPTTAWEMPAVPAPMKAMPANANPSFDVVTLKPSKPGQDGIGITVDGRRFSTRNTSVIAMMDFAYGTHPKQIVNAPAWMSDEKFDIEGTPDAEGAPNDRQWKGMLQKMLADRFGVKFHKDSREMPAYTLTVAKGGPKLEKSGGDADGLPGLFFSQLGNLHVMNANMGDFSHLMQEVVLDRPVVDETKLAGRWNFTLKWTPDETQFGGAAAKGPKPAEAADAPPPLFTAMPEEIGLRLEAARTAVPVLVIDHAEKPSEN